MPKTPSDQDAVKTPGRTMTLRQWATSLGDAVSLGEAPAVAGLPALEIARAIRRGEVVVREFRAVDGRVFRMVRRSELAKLAESRKLTIEKMAAAFRHMAGDDGTAAAEPTRRAA